MPLHARAWVDGVYDARKKRKGVVIEAFRGSTKTTTLTVTFTAFRIGQEPHRANLLIQASERSAEDNSGLVADIIENNPAWKAIFPHIVPDKNLGYGTNGYEVMRTDIGYEEWRRQNAARKDPTFVGLGRTSSAIIGKHPDGVLIIDDIDTETTTRSNRELSKTLSLLKGTIFPTMVPDKTWVVFVGTPWVRGDTIGYTKSTGEFVNFKTPVYDGDGKPIWPEIFHEKEIEKQRRLNGTLEFARMYLLDLSAAEGINLKREWLEPGYPFEKIQNTWAVVMGIDYASTADKQRDKERDYFALAIGRLIPGGGLVLVDGVREHLSEGEAIQKARAWGAMYPTLQLVGVEIHGGGEGYYQHLLTNSRLPIMRATTGKKLRPTAATSTHKGDRFQKQMAPMFEYNRVVISDAHTPFLNQFRKEWVGWESGGRFDDCLDAVYYMIWVATLLGNLAPMSEDFGKINERNWMFPKKRKENPFGYLLNG